MNLSSFKLTNINELISVYKENPERFNRFYNAVYLLLDSIPECGSIRVMDHCEASSYDLFIKCACWIIQEETEQKELTDALLEFSDGLYNYSPVREVRKIQILGSFLLTTIGVYYPNLLPCKDTSFI